MNVPRSSGGEAENRRSTFTVLVTGANSGLGFATCCRLMDEFLLTRPQSQHLHLLFTTRDARKSDDTLRRLGAHLQKTLRAANGRTMGVSLLLEGRVKMEGVLVDLLKLTSVKALAEQLLRRGQAIDAVVWNAGVAGWSGMNWPKAIYHVLTNLVHNTTYPTYPICAVGKEARPQLPAAASSSASAAAAAANEGNSGPEPKLGEVFTANVFGHYLLTHWLTPLMHQDTRIVWVSSISALPDTFSVSDIQGFRANMAYEGSKRLTDYVVLTSELPSTQPYVKTFLLPPSSSSAAAAASSSLASSTTTTTPDPRRPKMYATHPGVCGTSIADLHWTMSLLMVAVLYVARWLGSPWHVIDPYKGAVAPVFAVLAPAPQLPDLEVHEGKGKWGSVCNPRGDERVARTEVEGWGYCGSVGVVPRGSVTKASGRHRDRRETTREAREEFEEVGRSVWRELEAMRVEWEERLGRVEVAAAPLLDDA